MTDLEKIVPPPELCRQIPAGKFADSALVWTQGVDGMFIDFRDARPEDEEGNLPAPTLPEIMAELARRHALISVTALLSGGWQVVGWRTPAEEDSNPSTAAFRLWLNLEEENGATEKEAQVQSR